MSAQQGAHTLTFQATGAEQNGHQPAYFVRVTGGITAGDGVDPNDIVTSKTATGRVMDSNSETFEYTGEIRQLVVFGPIDVLRDGSRVDPGNVAKPPSGSDGGFGFDLPEFDTSSIPWPSGVETRNEKIVFSLAVLAGLVIAFIVLNAAAREGAIGR